MNSDLIEKRIPIIFLGVEKNRKNHLRELAQQLYDESIFENIKVILFLEPNFEITDVADAVWRFSNNIDPKRDHIMVQHHGKTSVAFDGTRKTEALDGFKRDWPNILASTHTTIQQIDAIWHKLGLGTFIKSPSLKYRNQLYQGGAVATD